MADDPTIFISYTRDDRALAVELHEALCEAGLSPWCDAVDLRAGDRWDAVIPRFLNRAAIVVVLISDHCPHAGDEGAGFYGPEEIAIAIARSRAVDADVRIVPVLVDGAGESRIPYGLRRIVPLGCSRGAVSAVVSPLRALLNRSGTTARPRPETKAELKAIKRRISLLWAQRAPADEIARVVEEKKALQRSLRAGGRLGPGDVLADRYVLGERLGSGGFASVWLAWDEVADRFVAVKVLHGRWNGDRTRIARFFRGARKMAGLNHPGIVRVFDPEVRCEDWHFFVMEYLAGGNLRDAILRGDAPLSVDAGLRALLQIAEALGVAHRAGIVHRDIKPENILLGADGRARLADFDLVRVADSTGGTATGAMGTYFYAAPEQLDRPQDVGPRADVYGLGMSAVFVLTGKAPSSASKQRPRETALALPAPPALRELVARSIGFDAAKRPADGLAFAAALREATNQGQALGSVSAADVTRVEPGTVIASVTDSRPAVLYIPAGDFVMGSPEDEEGRFHGEVQHAVRLPDAFLMSRTPVTQAQYLAVVGQNPSRFKGQPDDETRPVESVTWFDAARFCNALSEREGLSPVYVFAGEGDEQTATWDSQAAGYRLPTEAEWEYACRAGTVTATYAGPLPILGENNAPALDAIAWYRGNSGGAHPKAYDSSRWSDKQYPHERASSHLVAQKQPNGWGLYDMIGNVYEWCHDWYAPYAPSADGAPLAAPAGPAAGSARVIRGGSWHAFARRCRSAVRAWVAPGVRGGDLGFRLVRPPSTSAVVHRPPVQRENGTRGRR